MSSAPIRPNVGKNVYVADTAYVGGEVTIGDDCTIMHMVVIRGDVSAIRIGRRVNVQDGTVIHTETGVPLDIGDDVVIGHRAVVHCRRVGNGALIGIGSIVLDQSDIGDGAIIAAGAVVPPGTVIPPGKMVMGVPGRVVRDVTEREREYTRIVVGRYRDLAARHGGGVYPNIACR